MKAWKSSSQLNMDENGILYILNIYIKFKIKQILNYF